MDKIAQKIGTDIMFTSGENVKFVPIEETKWVDWMSCPNCVRNNFEVIRDKTAPKGFYHQCVNCNHKYF